MDSLSPGKRKARSGPRSGTRHPARSGDRAGWRLYKPASGPGRFVQFDRRLGPLEHEERDVGVDDEALGLGVPADLDHAFLARAERDLGARIPVRKLRLAAADLHLHAYRARRLRLRRVLLGGEALATRGRDRHRDSALPHVLHLGGGEPALALAHELRVTELELRH